MRQVPAWRRRQREEDDVAQDGDKALFSEGALEWPPRRQETVRVNKGTQVKPASAHE